MTVSHPLEGAKTVKWNADRIERARLLFLAGHTASEIAGILGGLTRSAVCGKLWRLGVGRQGPAAPTARMLARKAAAPRPVKRPRLARAKPRPKAEPKRDKVQRETVQRGAPVLVVIDKPCVPVVDLTPASCRWVVDTDQALYCPNTNTRPGGYCSGHRAIMFQPVQPRPSELARSCRRYA